MQTNFNETKQKLSMLLDSLFNRVISGTYIEPKQMDHFHNLCGNLAKLVGRFAEQIAIIKCSQINDAIKKAFEKLEAVEDKRYNDLLERVKKLEKDQE